MATNTDIREWGKLHAPELFKPKGPPSKRLQAAYYEQNPTGDGPVLDSLEFDPDYTFPAEDVVPESVPAAELPPGRGRRTLKDLFRRKKPAATKVTRAGARAPAERIAAGVWSLAAKLLESRAAPLSRVLMMQAPVAGVLIDREIKGTAVDVLVQPLARFYNKTSDIGVLFTLPAMVHMVSLRPELYPHLHDHMVDAILRWYEVAGPEMEKMAKRQAKRREQFNQGDGPSPEDLLQMIFAPMPDAPMEGATGEYATAQPGS